MEAIANNEMRELKFYIANNAAHQEPINLLAALNHNERHILSEYRPFFEEGNLPRQEERHEVVMIAGVGTDLHYKNIEHHTIIYTPGIADCIALGIYELDGAHHRAIKMSMVHFKTLDYNEPFAENYFVRLLHDMDTNNVRAVIASSKGNGTGPTGIGQYNRIAEILRDIYHIPLTHILAYVGLHNSSVTFAIASDLTFGECRVTEHSGNLEQHGNGRQNKCCIIA